MVDDVLQILVMATQSPLSAPVPVPEDPVDDENVTRLWIGNLDPKVTEFTLLKVLQKFGELEKFDFLYHTVGPDQGKSRGYCFVTYSSRQEAEKALKGLNGKLALSRRLVVRWAHKEESGDSPKPVQAKLTEEPKTQLSTDAKIQAIEMKLKNMEKSQKDFTMSLKPELPPGTSKYSATRTETSKKRTDKPYKRNNFRR